MVETPWPPADGAEEGLEVVRNLGSALLPEGKLVAIRVRARLEGYFIMRVKAQGIGDSPFIPIQILLHP
jgi:hypothetical protein